jgi:hypothetical protein
MKAQQFFAAPIALLVIIMNTGGCATFYPLRFTEASAPLLSLEQHFNVFWS